MSPIYYDVIIIGGGPSGSFCAISFKKQNPALKVCIIDKQEFPRNKPCGDGLSPSVVSLIHEVGVENFFEESSPVNSFILSFNNYSEIKYDLSKSFNSDCFGYVLPRKDFDVKLISVAKERGVDLFTKCSIVTIKDINESCTEIRCQYGNSIVCFLGRIIIGADGARSKLRKHLKILPNSDKHTGISLRYYCEITNLKHFSLRIDILKDVKHAYGWFFPISEGIANIGIGVDWDIYKNKKIDLTLELHKYVSFLQTKVELRLIPTTRAGALLPYGSQIAKLINGNKVLIGDAASMINPLTGEGIYYGMQAGKLLSKHLANKILTSVELTNKALNDFELEFYLQFKRHYQLNEKIKKLLSSSFSGHIFKLIKNEEILLDKALNVIFGTENSLNIKYLDFKLIKKIFKMFL